MDFQKAWDLYQTHYSSHQVLGRECPLKKTHLVKDLLEIAEAFDALLLDGFGVLNVGTSPIPNMPFVLNTLKSMGKSIFVLTNGASLPSHITALKYPKWGYPIPSEYVISSRDALVHALPNHPITQENKLWGVIGMPESDINSLCKNTLYLSKENDAHDLDRVDGFIFLGSMYWDHVRQDALLTSLRQKPRPILVGNPDMTAPLETSFTIEPGYYTLELESIQGVEIIRFGKPFPLVYELAYQEMNRIHQIHQLPSLKKERILMVGDTLHTDILGGNGAGMKTALMTDFGFLRGQDINHLIYESNISPDFIISGA